MPESLRAALAEAEAKGLLPAFPFGTDFTAEEQLLVPVLQRLAEAASSPATLLRLALRGLTGPELSPDARIALGRMGLDLPSGLKQRFYAALLRGALADA
jgi:hypothetical protein